MCNFNCFAETAENLLRAYHVGYEIYAKVSPPLRESSESSENYVKVVKITWKTWKQRSQLALRENYMKITWKLRVSNAGFSLVNYKIVRDNSTCLSNGNLDIAVVQGTIE